LWKAEFALGLGVRGEVGEEGVRRDAEVGHARLHLCAGDTAHPDDEVAAAVLPIAIVGPLINLQVGLPDEEPAEVGEALEPVLFDERDEALVDHDGAHQAGGGEGDVERRAGLPVPDDVALGETAEARQRGVGVARRVNFTP